MWNGEASEEDQLHREVKNMQALESNGSEGEKRHFKSSQGTKGSH